MKKLLLMISLLFLLTGCGKQDRIEGTVLSVTPDGENTKILLQTDNGKTCTILHHADTLLWSWVDGIDAEKLLAGEFPEAEITVFYPEKSGNAWLAGQIVIDSVVLPEAYTLSDGTKLNIRKWSGYDSYLLPDGTVLLDVQNPIGPENMSVGGLPSLDDLSPEAQEKIIGYYNELGLLYDLDAEIENIYRMYQAAENKADFQSSMLSQDISQTAANEKLIWYAAFVVQPVGSGLIHETRQGTVFDRETGERIEFSELFTCSEAEIGAAILDIAGMPDTELRQEMEQAFRLEYLIFHSDSLDVHFPVATLPSQNTDYILGIEYEDLAGILQPWAIPDSNEF